MDLVPDPHPQTQLIICSLQFIRVIISTHPTRWVESLLRDGGCVKVFNPTLVNRQSVRQAVQRLVSVI